MPIEEFNFGKGLLLDLPADKIPDGYCSDCEGVTLRNGTVHNMEAFNISGIGPTTDPPLGIHYLFALSGAGDLGSTFLYGDKTSLYNYAETVLSSGYSSNENLGWSIDNFGSVFIATNGIDNPQKIVSPYSAVADIGGTPPKAFQAVAFARHLFLLRQPSYPLRVSWSDIDNYEVWTATATNEAGDVDLTESSGFVIGAARCGNSLAVYTTEQIHLFNYIGLPYVFSRRVVSSQTGLLARRLLVEVGDVNYFINAQGLPMCFDGSRAFSIAPDNWRNMFGPTNPSTGRERCFAINVSYKREVWFFSNLTASSPYWPNVAWIFNYDEGTWSKKTMNATCGESMKFADPVTKYFYDIPYVADSTHEYSFDSYVDSREWVGEDPELIKTIYKVEVICQNDQSDHPMRLYIGTRSLPGDSVSWSSSYEISPSSPKVDVRVSARRMRFRIRANSVGNTYTLSKIIIHYKVEGSR